MFHCGKINIQLLLQEVELKLYYSNLPGEWDILQIIDDSYIEVFLNKFCRKWHLWHSKTMFINSNV